MMKHLVELLCLELDEASGLELDGEEWTSYMLLGNK